MTDTQHNSPAPGNAGLAPGNAPAPRPGEPLRDPETEHELEEYAGGHIQAWVGHIPAWLLVVYAILFVWALYYEHAFWGNVGPGRPLW